MEYGDGYGREYSLLFAHISYALTKLSTDLTSERLLCIIQATNEILFIIFSWHGPENKFNSKILLWFPTVSLYCYYHGEQQPSCVSISIQTFLQSQNRPSPSFTWESSLSQAFLALHYFFSSVFVLARSFLISPLYHQILATSKLRKHVLWPGACASIDLRCHSNWRFILLVPPTTIY